MYLHSKSPKEREEIDRDNPLLLLLLFFFFFLVRFVVKKKQGYMLGPLCPLQIQQNRTAEDLHQCKSSMFFIKFSAQTMCVSIIDLKQAS